MHDLATVKPNEETTRGRGMFLFSFNKLGWLGSILVSVALTLVLILAFRLFNG
jgi:hypothetical protein